LPGAGDSEEDPHIIPVHSATLASAHFEAQRRLAVRSVHNGWPWLAHCQSLPRA
jgi:hypothetical protein